MFFALQNDIEYWKNSINIFIALAPVTKLDHTKSELFLYAALLGNLLLDTLYAIHVYSLFGPATDEITKITCGVLPSLC